jgi:hypothetical protein
MKNNTTIKKITHENRKNTALERQRKPTLKTSLRAAGRPSLGDDRRVGRHRVHGANPAHRAPMHRLCPEKNMEIKSINAIMNRTVESRRE